MTCVRLITAMNFCPFGVRRLRWSVWGGMSCIYWRVALPSVRICSRFPWESRLAEPKDFSAFRGWLWAGRGSPPLAFESTLSAAGTVECVQVRHVRV
jgi:hypothetical protein